MSGKDLPEVIDKTLEGITKAINAIEGIHLPEPTKNLSSPASDDLPTNEDPMQPSDTHTMATQRTSRHTSAIHLSGT